MPSLARLVAVSALSLAIASCAGDPSPLGPTPPSTNPPPAETPTLMVFHEPSTGFSSSDLYDAHDQVIQLTHGGDLVFSATGVRVHGPAVAAYSNYYGPPTYFIASQTQMCDDPCDLSVRFGADGGRRRAYLTVDYGHFNPGTRVDVAVVNGAVAVTQTATYPPGTPTLSGTITEMTPAGRVPVAGALVSRGVPAGWQSAYTDEDGLYTIRGLTTGTDEVSVGKEGYQRESRQLLLTGDTQLDLQLTRR